ncbi:MAG: otopetrin domain-containing protein [Candidatus Methanoplasma sp.]|nr:otopetrin domain-containing protein [Candidatus Methanoplasma sp.]
MVSCLALAVLGALCFLSIPSADESSADEADTVTLIVDPENYDDNADRADGAKYKTLAAAVGKAVSGDIIDITGRVAINSGINLSRTLTITSSDGKGEIVRATGYKGQFFSIVSGTSITFDNVIIDGGAVYVNGGNTGATGVERLIYSYGNLTLTGGTVVRNNSATGDAGGLILSWGGKLIVDGAELYGGRGTSGGAVSLIFEATAEFISGSIHDNQAYNAASAPGGGAVMLQTGSASIEKDFKIYNNQVHSTNKQSVGGAISMMGANLTINGGEIYNNTAGPSTAGGYGGAIGMNGGSITMNGGSIYGNEATHWGGALYYGYSPADSTFTMRSGSVYINKVTGTDEAEALGGGIAAIESGGKVYTNLLGGNICGNEAPKGGGVYNSRGSLTINYMTVSGNKAIGNSKTDFNKSDGSGGGIYNYRGTVTMSNSTISGNEAKIRGGGICNYIGTFDMASGEISGNKVTAGIWSDGGGGVANIYAGSFTMITGIIAYNTAPYASGGGVYNAYTFTDSPVSPIFTLNGGEISDNEAGNYGGGVFNYSSGTFIMHDGEISRNIATSYGGGVFNYSNAAFTMNDGVISCNKTTISGSYGGGVANYSSTFTMNDGEISGNNATSYGGGVANYAGTLTMNDGKISGNTAGTYGGGVDNYYNSTFMMNDGEISRNIATSYGGGVSNRSSAFTMNDGVISGNETTSSNSYGGGVFNYSSGTFIMHDGEISRNIATSYGGGVANYASTFTMNDGEISGNTATSYGGGVFNYSNSAFTMNDGEISGNKATGTTGYGGGVANYSSTFTMNNGEISGNKASLGGGVHNYGNNTVSIKSGKITGNTATGTDTKGSGGGIYTTDFSKLTVADGVIFSGNTAPTLRIQDIADDANIDGNGVADVTDYSSKIGTVVLSDFVLNALAGPNKNAPAYNNYDINYPGDVYVVTVDIYPEGSGSVTVTDTADSIIVYGVLTENGYVLVPIAAASITFSADAENDYVFIKFVKDKTDEEITDNPADISVTGNMHMLAVFESPAPSPDLNNYTITSSARDGASISPAGNISVREGENATFSFHAGPGYRISSVYADGYPVSAEALASGTYTFYDVRNNHTIEATGTPYAASPDSGSGEGGSGSGGSESGRGNSGWAVLNLVFALIAIAAGIFAVIAGRNRYKEEDKDNSSKERLSKRLIPEIASLILGIVSVIVFFITEDMNLTPIVADIWTVLMLVLAIAALVSAFLSFRSEEEENLEDWNTDTEYV